MYRSHEIPCTCLALLTGIPSDAMRKVQCAAMAQVEAARTGTWTSDIISRASGSLIARDDGFPRSPIYIQQTRCASSRWVPAPSTH